MSVLEDGRPNLALVNQAYGFSSDLYMDVLHVQPNAGSEQIQDAYFDRRNELFQLLADIDADDQDSITESHRKHAERKMDAVVSAVRILGDPDLRLQYDDLRAERIAHSKNSRAPQRRSPPKRPVDHYAAPDDEQRHILLNASGSTDLSYGHHMNQTSLLSSTTDMSSYYTEASASYVQEEKPRRKARVVTPPSRKPVTKKTMRTLEEDSAASESLVSDDEETLWTQESRLSHMPKKQGLLERVKSEILGAVDDTAKSLEQVLNVFTLQEEDISAVVGRIDKAKRQMWEPPMSPPKKPTKASRKSRR